jgi:hypothetical protein
VAGTFFKLLNFFRPAGSKSFPCLASIPSTADSEYKFVLASHSPNPVDSHEE